MTRLFGIADQYLQKSDWKDLAAIKLCLFSMGVLAGTAVAKPKKQEVRLAAALLFTVTYIPLMVKFLSILVRNKKSEEI